LAENYDPPDTGFSLRSSLQFLLSFCWHTGPWPCESALCSSGWPYCSAADGCLRLPYAGATGRGHSCLWRRLRTVPIGWIVLNVIFMYQLTVESGRFTVLQHSLTGITKDRACNCCSSRSVSARSLRRSGFRYSGGRDGRAADRPWLQAAAGSGLSLIANTAPVAFGALALR